MIENEIQRIDTLLDQKIQQVQLVLKTKKSLDYSLINNDLVYLYNEMLALSYSLKLWLLNGLLSVTEHPEELLKVVKDQFKNILHLVGHDESLSDKNTISMRCILPYQQVDQTI